MNTIIKPIITEKMTAAGEKNNCYGFVVDRKANKYQIKNAVEELYEVKVEAVNTIVQRGKRTARNTKSGYIVGRKSTFKKAIVKIKDGQIIDFYSNI